MRIVIAKEGGEVEDGRIIAPGAFKWEDGRRYPVTISFNHERYIGYATDIRRESDGSITAEVTLTGAGVGDLEDDVFGSVSGGKLEVENSDGRVLKSLALQSVSLVDHDFWGVGPIKPGADETSP